METNKEVEMKFHMPDGVCEDELISGIKAVLLEESWSILSDRADRRSFLYYDTPGFEVYNNSETIRRVSGFDAKVSIGGIRYDYKTGSIDCRLEAKHWSNQVLSPEQIIQELHLPFKMIIPVAPAETYHRLLDIEKGKTLIEVKIDDYDLFGGIHLRELELEVMKGEEKLLREISGELKRRLGLDENHRQKYTRIVEMKLI
jgi:hypothetical protein